MSISTSLTNGETVEATIHAGPNGERGVMCFLSAEQLSQLGIGEDAESVTYYVADQSLVVEE